MPPPSHSPMGGDTGRLARGAQAYAYSLLGGGTQQDAELAAGKIVDALEIPQVAAMARGAIAAGRSFGTQTLAKPYKPGGRQYQQFKSGMAAAGQEGMTTYLATVVFYYTPGGAQGLSMGLEQRSSVVQVDIPLDATYTEAQRIMMEAARQAAEGSQSRYPGTFHGFSVRTIIGT